MRKARFVCGAPNRIRSVALDPDGKSQFEELLFRRGEARFQAFDLLWCDGDDLQYSPLIERKVQELPLLGRIAAGRPLEAVEERETISLGDFARGGNSYVLQVKGNSMIEDHIMDGDFVVCEQTQVANAGDIVVALVRGDEATLKRFYREGPGKIRLQPANSEMGPIIEAASDVKIQGRVIGVLRKY